MNLHFCKAGAANWLAKYYEKVGYGREFSDQDDLYYAEENGLEIGVVRIARENSVLVLRGMYVSAPFQGKGIGTELLEYLELSLGSEPIYCILKDHLIEFYGKIDFSVIDPNDAPEFLLERLSSYISRDLKVLIMKRGSRY